MADDPAMLRLLVATEAAGSKLVIIGDHRQIGAVGPGGSLEALISRHRGGVHVLTDNVRQADPDERAVLAELRAGDVDQAINWYAQHQHVKVAPNREEVLDQMAADWAKDVAKGRETAMLAWRWANVAALNSRARAAMAQAGRLSGPELRVGGNVYQAGDRVVTLAPSAHGQLVTSQRGQVIAVDPGAGALTVSVDDGNTHTLGGGDRPRPPRPRLHDDGPPQPGGHVRHITPLCRRRWPGVGVRRDEPGEGLFPRLCCRRQLHSCPRSETRTVELLASDAAKDGPGGIASR